VKKEKTIQKSSFAFLVLFALLASSNFLLAQNVGINTTTPGVDLDVNGTIRLNESLVLTPPSAVAAGTTITLTSDYSSYIISDDAANLANAISITGTPKEGQVLYILNNDAQTLVFGAETINSGSAGYFIYLNSGWRNLFDGLTSESDPQVSFVGNNRIPRWDNDSSALINGSIQDDGTDITLSNNLLLPTGDLTMSLGDLTLSAGGMTVAGKTTLDSLISGVLTSTGLTVSGNTALGNVNVTALDANTLTVTGEATLDNITSDSVSLNGALDLVGALSTTSLSVSGGSTLENLQVNGSTSLDSVSASLITGTALDITNVIDASTLGITITPDLSVGNLTINGLLTNLSDFRYKEEIAPLEGALNNVLKMNGVIYNWNQAAFPEKQFSDKLQIGFIAQDLEEIYPDLVHTDANGYKSVEYHKVAPILVEAVKEQQALISSQAETIKEIKSENTLINASLEQLKAEKDALELRLQKLENLVETLK